MLLLWRLLVVTMTDLYRARAANRSQLEPVWRVSYDVDPARLKADPRSVLERAVAEALARRSNKLQGDGVGVLENYATAEDFAEVATIAVDAVLAVGVVPADEHERALEALSECVEAIDHVERFLTVEQKPGWFRPAVEARKRARPALGGHDD